MRRRLLPAMLLGCAIAALSAAPAAAALETIVQDDAAMLYSDPAGAQAAAQRLQGLGVDRVRITANWSVLTRDASSKVRPHFDARDPAAYEQARWANLDNAVRAIRAAGLTVLIDIGFWAPHWATSSPPGPKARANVKPKDYANFAVALVRRYSGKFAVPSGTPAPPPPPAEDENPFKTLLMPLFPSLGNTDPPPVVVAPQPDPLPRVSVFALWNEPNFPGLLLPQWKTDKRTPASPRVYRRMVLAAYPAIKKARSGTRVLVGNTSSVGGNPGTGAVAPLAFIRGFACVDSRLRPRTTGECAHFHRIPGDGWAHHPYTRNQPPRARGPKPDDVQIVDLPKLARTLSELVRRGRLAAGYRRIYLTEFGFETKRVGTRPRVSQAAQGRWLTWSEYLADRVPAVKSFAQFLLRDQPPADKVVSNSDARAHGEYSTGLLTADGTPKTAARTFRAGLFAALGSGGRRVMLYGRLRLGPGKKAITLQRRAGAGAWTTIDRFELDGQGAFQRTFANRGDAIYRLTFPGQAGVRKNGLAVRPVSRPR